jgi:AbrB family looped-hinge helix DNA binding protein
MKHIVLKVDSKGRIQLPKDIREGLGIRNEVGATIENGIVTIEPVGAILNRLSKTTRFKYRSVESALPSLRKAAERQLLKEIS